MKGHLITTILFCVAANAAYAQEGFAVCNFGKQKVPSVICYGPAVLKSTVVTGNIKVVGPLTAISTMANSITVSGSANLQDSEVSGDVDVTGSLQTQNVHFYKGITIQGDDTTLSNSIVQGDITMNSSATKPVITLECKTTVTGSIIFGGIAGVVQVSNDSTLVGKIKNGETQFIRVSC